MVQHGNNPEDYMTSVIGNKTVDWLANVSMATDSDASTPFFAYVAVHAPHVPATPAPWYNNSLPGNTAPR